jgi:hypothetical protein
MAVCRYGKSCTSIVKLAPRATFTLPIFVSPQSRYWRFGGGYMTQKIRPHTNDPYLADSYCILGHQEAFELNLQAPAVRKRVLGDQHTGTLNSMLVQLLILQVSVYHSCTILHSSLRLQLRSGDYGLRWSSPIVSVPYACSLALASRSHQALAVMAQLRLAELQWSCQL